MPGHNIANIPWLLDEETPSAVLGDMGDDGAPLIFWIDAPKGTSNDDLSRLAEHLVNLHNAALAARQ
jgi:hypothetical protein